MKITNDSETCKMKIISSAGRPHSHDIVKVDKTSGSVKEIHKGPNAPRRK